MASKLIYPVVAVLGIAAVSAGAWWYQNKASAPKQVVGGAAEGAAAGAAPRGGGAGGPRVIGVEVAKVQKQRLQDDAQSVGSLRSRQAVMLRPEVAGRVKEIGFSDGAFVRRGQLLVQLDDTLQRAEIRQAQAQVSIAQANFKRNQDLVAQSFVTQRVLDESAASLQVAEAQLSLGCARLMRMAIVAPFDGTVGLRNVNLGDYVKDGADLVNLEDTGSMYVDFRLPERFQGRLRVRQPVELQLDAFPGRVFRATVEAIDPLLDVNGRSVGVRAVLPNSSGEPAQGGGRGGAGKGVAGNSSSGSAGAGSAGAGGAGGAGGGATPQAPAATPAKPEPVVAAAAPRVTVPARAPAAFEGCPVPEDQRMVAGAGRAGGGSQAPLRPGMFARVTTVFSVRESALVVPEEAIVPQGGRQFVIKVVESPVVPASAGGAGDAKLVSQRQQVTLGARQLGKVEIVDGVSEGDRVVVAGHQRLQGDNVAVRIVPSGGQESRGPGGGKADAPAGAASSGKAPVAGQAPNVPVATSAVTPSGLSPSDAAIGGAVGVASARTLATTP